MGRLRFAVIMLAWGMAARGAEVGDADSAMAARIEFLRDANAKMKGRLEKIRGAISYWAEQGFTADKDEEEGPAASAEPASASDRGRRLESKLPGGGRQTRGRRNGRLELLQQSSRSSRRPQRLTSHLP